MWARLHGLIGKEFAQMLRDPVVLFLIFWLTTTEVAMCTMAVGMDVKNLPLGLIDHDRSGISRALTEELTSADTFVLARIFSSGREAEAVLRRGDLAAVVEIPPNFGVRAAAGRPASFGVIIDGADANVASRARAYIIEMTARLAQRRALGAPHAHAAVEPSVRVLYKPKASSGA